MVWPPVGASRTLKIPLDLTIGWKMAKTRQEENNYFEMLPDVALIEILSYLHSTEVDNVTKLSRRCFALSRTRTAARNITLSRCHNRPWSWMLDYLHTLSDADVMTGVLDLSHNQWIPAKSFEKLVNFMVNVTSLDVTGCCISEQAMHKILSKTSQLRTLAFTDRGFDFSGPRQLGDPHEIPLSEDSLGTLSRLTHLSITFLMCSKELSVLPYCQHLTALRLDQHLNSMYTRKNCFCTMRQLSAEHFRHLKKYSQTRAHSQSHPDVTTFMTDVLKRLLLNGTKFTKLFIPFTSDNADATLNVMDDRPQWTSNLSHTDVPINGKEPVPSLRYLKTDIVRLKNVEDLTIKYFPNIQYLCICQGTLEEVGTVIEEMLCLLPLYCPHILGLCFSEIHLHQTSKNSPTAHILGRLKRLQYLSVSPCAFVTHTQEIRSIFDTDDDISERTLTLSNGVENGHDELKDISGLVQACHGLTELELIYPHTRVCLRFPLDGTSDTSECLGGSAGGSVPTDATLSALGHLKYLQRLTLGGIQGVRHGAGFTSIFRECRQLSYLSLADFGLRGQCLWMPAFCDALKYASSLQDLRIEHKNLPISARLLSSLHGCVKLRRLCLISEKGRMEQPSYFLELIEGSKHLSLLVVCSADSLPIRRKMRVDIKKKFKELRPALSIVFGSAEELKSQDGQQETLKSVPNIDLEELVLFRHHVCSPERHNGIT